MPVSISEHFSSLILCCEQNSVMWKPWDPPVFTLGALDLSLKQTVLDEFLCACFISQVSKQHLKDKLFISFKTKHFIFETKLKYHERIYNKVKERVQIAHPY